MPFANDYPQSTAIPASKSAPSLSHVVGASPKRHETAVGLSMPMAMAASVVINDVVGEWYYRRLARLVFSS